MTTAIRDILTGKVVVYKSIVARLITGRHVVRGQNRSGKKWDTLMVCKDDGEACRMAVMLDSGREWKRNGNIFVDDDALPRKHKPEVIS